MGRSFVQERQTNQPTLSRSVKSRSKPQPKPKKSSGARVKGLPMDQRIDLKFGAISEIIRKRIHVTVQLFPRSEQSAMEEALLRYWNDGADQAVSFIKMRAKSLRLEMNGKNEKTKWGKLSREIKEFINFALNFISTLAKKLSARQAHMKNVIIAEYLESIFKCYYNTGSQGVKCVWNKGSLKFHETLDVIFMRFPELQAYTATRSLEKDDGLTFFQTITNIRAGAMMEVFAHHIDTDSVNDSQSESPCLDDVTSIPHHALPPLNSLPCPVPMRPSYNPTPTEHSAVSPSQQHYPVTRFTPAPLHMTGYSLPPLPRPFQGGLPQLQPQPQMSFSNNAATPFGTTTCLPQHQASAQHAFAGSFSGNGMPPCYLDGMQQERLSRQARQFNANPLGGSYY